MMTTTVPIISFVGKSNAGKTTTLEGLVRQFGSHGYRVAVVKHVHHQGFDLDQPGKDSWRFAQAGAATVLLSSKSNLALIEETAEEWPLERLLALLGDRVDLILAEGYSNGRTPKVEVHRSGVSESIHTPLDELWAVVTDTPLATPVRQFTPFDSADLATFLLEKLALYSRSQHLAQESSGSDAAYGGESGAQQQRLEELMSEASAYHGHLCPGQVLGVRMALLGCSELGLEPPDRQKRLLVFVETDRCATDAISTVTGCKLGTRSLKFLDYGKMAATFLDIRTGRAVRVVARDDSRNKVPTYAPQVEDTGRAQLSAYKIMPDNELFIVQAVSVDVPEQDLPGRPRRRVICEGCREGVSDSREVYRWGRVLCRPCASGSPYYQPLALSVTREHLG
jgi:formylmethanofuran dehydrogenase subunit E